MNARHPCLLLLLALCPGFSGCATILLWRSGPRAAQAYTLIGMQAAPDSSRVFVRAGFYRGAPRTFEVTARGGQLLPEGGATPAPQASPEGSPRSELRTAGWVVRAGKRGELVLQPPGQEPRALVLRRPRQAQPYQVLLTPLSLAWDVATLPIQLILFGIFVWR